MVRNSTGGLEIVAWVRMHERDPDGDGGRAMNNRRIGGRPSPQIVGYAELFTLQIRPAGSYNRHCITSDANFHVAFMYDGAMHNLNDMIPPQPPNGWFLSEAWGINDRGQIVGRGLLNGVHHAYLLLP
jgi:hypothetical protein